MMDEIDEGNERNGIVFHCDEFKTGIESDPLTSDGVLKVNIYTSHMCSEIKGTF